MKKLLLLVLLLPAWWLAQSPFNGTWIIDSNAQLPEKPVVYLLERGMFRCDGCLANGEIKADGDDQKVEKTSYWDTVSVRIVDTDTVEIIAKKSGKTMFTELDTVSSDGRNLSQLMKDTTEAQPATVETLSKRVGQGASGSHLLSGSWQAYKINRSKNGAKITYKCTPDGFSAETPLPLSFVNRSLGLRLSAANTLSNEHPPWQFISILPPFSVMLSDGFLSACAGQRAL